VITVNDNSIATVSDLIAALSDYDPATPVRIATESALYMDYALGRVVRTDPDPDADCDLPNDMPIVRISTGTTYCCLPDSAADALGWAS
jgi:hypothetical protein